MQLNSLPEKAKLQTSLDAALKSVPNCGLWHMLKYKFMIYIYSHCIRFHAFSPYSLRYIGKALSRNAPPHFPFSLKMRRCLFIIYEICTPCFVCVSGPEQAGAAAARTMVCGVSNCELLLMKPQFPLLIALRKSVESQPVHFPEGRQSPTPPGPLSPRLPARRTDNPWQNQPA